MLADFFPLSLSVVWLMQRSRGAFPSARETIKASANMEFASMVIKSANREQWGFIGLCTFLSINHDRLFAPFLLLRRQQFFTSTQIVADAD